MMLVCTGDIIIATAANQPFLRHAGLILVQKGMPWIMHNTPMKRNAYGGNLIVEPLEQFLADGRQILQRWHSSLRRERLISSAEAVKHVAFDKFNWNCEQFVNYVLYCETRSPQRDSIIAMGCIVGLLMLSL